MTDDERVALGSFCETVMGSDAWTVIVGQFEQQLFQHMMTTEAHEQKKREGIYATFKGMEDFHNHMKALVEQKNKIIQPEPLPDWAPQAADLDD